MTDLQERLRKTCLCNLAADTLDSLQRQLAERDALIAEARTALEQTLPIFSAASTGAPWRTATGVLYNEIRATLAKLKAAGKSGEQP